VYRFVDLEIPAPPAAPLAPSGLRLYRLVPVLMGIGAALGAAVWQFGRGNVGWLLVGTLLLVAISVGGASIVPRWELALYRRRLRQRERAYRDLLDVQRAKLASVVTMQQSTLAARDPDPHACVRLATADSGRLWQRAVADQDGLWVRIGTSDEPSSVAIRAPRQVEADRPDPLIELAQALAAKAARLPDRPQMVPLFGLTGVCGPRPAVLETVRALIVQLAAHYPPEQLRLGIFFSSAEMDEWRWARWLPHVVDGERSARWLVSESDSARVPSRAEVFVAIVADPALAGCVPSGARRVLLAARAADLPDECSVILDVDAPPRAALRIAGEPPRHIDQLDTAPSDVAEQFARALAGLRPRPGGDGSAEIQEVQLDGSYRTLR
jgi:S-DNA-T family DNA segregation ATPase FtsK/SpoIIIE